MTIADIYMAKNLLVDLLNYQVTTDQIFYLEHIASCHLRGRIVHAMSAIWNRGVSAVRAFLTCSTRTEYCYRGGVCVMFKFL